MPTTSKEPHVGSTVPADLKAQLSPTKIYLTFDDGPDGHLTPKVLDLLAQHDLYATFFVLLDPARANVGLLREIRKKHLLGVHGKDHKNQRTKSTEQFARDVAEVSDFLDSATIKEHRYFRYPGGDGAPRLNQALHTIGFSVDGVGWDIDSEDWAFNNGSQHKQGVPAKYGKQDFGLWVLDQCSAKRGGVILMHDIHAFTVAHLPWILDKLIQTGFQFGKLPHPDTLGLKRGVGAGGGMGSNRPDASPWPWAV
jgi:peptidoglycan/xylan/chitin deacetylase (PgdA/CDA1 family)